MGFWGALAGIGASLIPGVGPFIAPIVAGAVNGLTSGGSGGSANGGATQQLSVDAGKPYESTAVTSGLDTLQAPKNYFKAALGGSQEQLQGLLGPEVSTVLDQYDNASKTAAELGPRGGGRTAVMAEAPFKKAGAYGQALAGARAGAADKLAGIGEAEAGIGNQQEQIKNQFKLGQAGINVNQNKTQFEGQQAKNKSLSDLGSGVGGILTRVISSAKGGGGGFGSGEGKSVGSGSLLNFGSMGGDSGE